ncbi:MAG: phosphonate C-P lyase system protein PhnH [Pseudomonadota bacterium]
MASDSDRDPSSERPAADTPAIGSSRAFRTILGALARPGRIERFVDPIAAPAPLSEAAAQVLTNLSDADARLWLGPSRNTPDVAGFLRFQTGAAPIATPDLAAFVCGTWSEIAGDALAALPVGTPEYPDRSATLAIEVDALSNEPIAGSGAVLRGPGVDGAARLWVGGATNEFWAWAQENAARFPLGLDVIFTAGDRIAGLPRSTIVEPV